MGSSNTLTQHMYNGKATPKNKIKTNRF